MDEELTTALNNGDLENVKLYFDGHKDTLSNTALMTIFWKRLLEVNDLGIMKWILSEHDFRNWETENGSSLLHISIEMGSYEIVAEILERYGVSEKRDKDGFTGLHEGVFRGNRKIVVELLTRGFFVDATDSDLHTPLHWAVHRNDFEIAFVLVYWGANVNARDKTGQSPLHFACLNGNGKLIDLLVKGGADVKMKDNLGQTPSLKLLGVMGRLSQEEAEEIQKSLKGHSSKGKNNLCIGKDVVIVIVLIQTLLMCGLNLRMKAWAWIVILGYIFVVEVLNVVLFVKNPGRVVPPDAREMEEYLLEGELGVVCVVCKLIRPPRSKHCGVCGHCVTRFDHHCGWIGNDVGAGNHALFLLFLLLFMVGDGVAIALLIACFIVTAKNISVGRAFAVNWSSFVSLPALVFGFVFPAQLLMQHMVAGAHNLTTNEMMNAQRYERFWDNGRFTNPHDRGCCANLRELFCACCLPRTLHPTTRHNEDGHELMGREEGLPDE
ncbi:putative S-acyltransferase TIP1 [Blattamonas nauphoetae]|uniref:Palmitoyltransferase n=1 Tax=Blattamonas nauphoetae TaxID=2049346 RepID=A0ABQ9Y5Q7_9EUKA|nr:putative S-acyltransferase TIP1 [Blattamonas nauphoetae]